MSRHPVPFPRGGVSLPFLGELFDGTNWAVSVELVYANSVSYTFYTDYTFTIVEADALNDAYQWITPYQNLMGGELLNFYLKPRFTSWS
jgi:hypothetical protein